MLIPIATEEKSLFFGRLWVIYPAVMVAFSFANLLKWYLCRLKPQLIRAISQNCFVYAPPSEPFVSSVGFYFPVGSLGLYGTIHAEQCTMNTVQVFENLFVERSQFIVQPNDSVKLTFMTFGSVRQPLQSSHW